MKKVLYLAFALVLLFFGYRHFLAHVPEERPRPPAAGNIICFGDSLTSGYGASPGMDYPSQLSRRLGLPVINAGVPGDTTADALKRLDADVLSRSPRIVLITLGGNDLKNRLPAETAFRNLQQIVETIQRRGALVILGGIDIPLYGRGFDDGYRKVAERTGAVLIPDILAGILGNPKRMSDPIHPDDRGYRMVADRFYESVPPDFWHPQVGS